MIINKYIKKSGIFVILILMYGIVVLSGPAVMRFFILLAKTALGKKRPFMVLWYCSFARARGRIFKWEEGRGGGGELMRTHKREQTLWVRMHAPQGKFQI